VKELKSFYDSFEEKEIVFDEKTPDFDEMDDDIPF
jgi:hypothetical protein